MRIVNLIDNIEGRSGCSAEHGLCYYVETEDHVLLADTGASELFAENAEKLGVDLSKVDTVILSHGHFDHGGGLPTFFERNRQAKVYMQKSAFGEYYGINEEGPHYIGLPKELKESGRILFAEGDLEIDRELYLFSDFPPYRPSEAGSDTLKVQTEKGLVPDDFRHEQCLVITQGKMKLLFSGCAHHGIVTILKKYRERFGSDPDYVFSGFHLKKRSEYTGDDFTRIRKIAEELKNFSTRFYTGHCTGKEPYQIMKEILGEQLEYVHCGDEIRIGTE